MPQEIPTQPFLDEPLQEGDQAQEVLSTSFAVVTCGPHPGDPAEWLSCSEVAEKLGVSDQTILNWAKEWWFPSPLDLNGRKKWAPGDLRLFNAYVIRRSRDLANGGKGLVPAPEYCV